MLKNIRANEFASGFLIYFSSNIINAIIPFALLPILTRYLMPEEYGQVAMFQTLLGALGAFVGLSVVGSAGRKYYDSNITRQEMGQYIGASIQILMVSTCCALAILYGFRSTFSRWLGLEEQWVLWAVFVTAGVVIMGLRLGQWQVRKQPKRYGVMQVSYSLLNMGLSIALVVIVPYGADGRISAEIIAASTFCFLALMLLKREGLLTLWVWRPDFYKEIIKFGVPLIPHVGGVFLLTSVDRFVINSKLGISDAGVYMVAVQIAAGTNLIFNAINKAYVPWLFERLKRNNLDELKKIVRYTYIWFAIVFLGAIVGFFVGPWIVGFIAGPRYKEAEQVIGWLLLGQAFGGMYLMVTNYIFFSKQTGLLSIATFISGIINLFLLIVLVSYFGLTGAAVAFCVAMAIRFLFTWWAAHKRYPMPWFNFD
ncbi:oligosaccharide flippase family protein [Pusillimonas sp. MFBS29]|uniref:lipopolysaccharide biosynthesis protein n=1 Tax=Pusillimonas sp. MFBS29 TaxID=2886690 RepID=UPI001D111912|nr:oligosaccharide flippase family protein [Pusillimonas sp. MFBS29]MCC2597551.1 oligosaccharide flippase family protein [Pusillimonas sp. MFBS29]